MKRILLLTGMILGMLAPAGLADDALQYWAANFSKPEVQLKILQRIFPATGSDLSAAVQDKATKTYLFPRGSSWLQLSPSFVWNPGTTNTLIVTCLLRNHREDPPVNATSYAFSSATDRVVPITPGYAANETITKVVLPNVRKSFLVVEDIYPQQTGLVSSSFVFLLDLDPAALRGNPTTVWKNPSALRYFQIGFASLSGNGPEELVLRTLTTPRPMGTTPSVAASADSGITGYSAYRWTGSQFEEDSMVFVNRIKTLPEEVWKYGTGR